MMIRKVEGREYRDEADDICGAAVSIWYSCPFLWPLTITSLWLSFFVCRSDMMKGETKDESK